MKGKNALYRRSFVIVGVFILGILWNILKYVLPVLIVVAVLFYIINYKEIKSGQIKWHEGSTTDAYYQKQKKEEAIDVEVKVKKSDDQTL